MTISLRRYQDSDFETLVSFMEKLQDYSISCDPFGLLRRLPGYGTGYSNALLERIEKENGRILLAQLDNTPVGVIAGVIREQTQGETLAYEYVKRGRILELFVEETARSHGVGAALMEGIESYFREQQCTLIRIQVFAPNTNAYEFYRNRGYQDDVADLIKKIA